MGLLKLVSMSWQILHVRCERMTVGRFIRRTLNPRKIVRCCIRLHIIQIMIFSSAKYFASFSKIPVILNRFQCNRLKLPDPSEGHTPNMRPSDQVSIATPTETVPLSEIVSFHTHLWTSMVAALKTHQPKCEKPKTTLLDANWFARRTRNALVYPSIGATQNRGSSRGAAHPVERITWTCLHIIKCKWGPSKKERVVGEKVQNPLGQIGRVESFLPSAYRCFFFLWLWHWREKFKYKWLIKVLCNSSVGSMQRL